MCENQILGLGIVEAGREGIGKKMMNLAFEEEGKSIFKLVICVAK